MRALTIELRNPSGLHARPAALLVGACRPLKSRVVLRANGKVADGRSILQVLSLGASKGVALTVEADGEDEEAALSLLADMISAGLGELPME